MCSPRTLVTALLLFVCGAATAADVLLTMDQYGPVQIGMTVNEAYLELKRLKGQGVANPKEVAKEGCDYYHPFAGLSFMTDSRIIVRIETTDRDAVTPSGIRVGDPISKVRSRFGRRLRDEQQHYADNPRARTLTVISLDGQTAMRFEAGDQVDEIYSGYEHSIHYVEGCS